MERRDRRKCRRKAAD